MTKISTLLISMMVFGTMITSFAVILSAGNTIFGKTFNEDLSEINKTMAIYGQIAATGNPIQSQETQPTDLGVFSVTGAWSALLGLFSSVSIFTGWVDAIVRILNIPAFFAIPVKGTLILIFVYAILNTALGRTPEG